MLQLPPLLVDLVAAGRWPSNPDEERAQNLRSLVPTERIQKFAPEYDRIYLLAPPLHTIRERVNNGDDFWNSPQAAPSEIDFDLVLDVGDFGLGSDAPILLDYTTSASNPRVIRLVWSSSKTKNHWQVVTLDFSAFVKLLGI
jgi:hypothetical protein